MITEKEIESYCKGEITCPYCEWEDCDSWETDMRTDGDSQEVECPDCDKKFYVQLNIEYSYTSQGLCKENKVKHNWKEFDHTTDGERCKGRKCLTCNKYEFDRKEKSGGEDDTS